MSGPGPRRAADVLEEAQAIGARLTLYHGTSSGSMLSIRARGLLPRRPSSVYAAVARQIAGVFCTLGDARRYAQYWAARRVERIGGAPIVLSFDVDAADVVPDPINDRCFLVVTRSIAWEEVRAVEGVAMLDRWSFLNMASYQIKEA